MNLKKIALVSIAAAAVAAAPAFAACPDPAPTFGTTIGAFCPANDDTGGLCAVRNASANTQARFWGFTKGNFAVDNTVPNCPEATCGSDNGSYAYNDIEPGGDGTVAWLLDGGPGTVVISGDWAGAGQRTNMIDGCPTTQAGKTTPIMMVGLSDQGAGGVGLLAIGSARNTPGAKADYDFSFINGATTGDMILRPVRPPNVTASSNIDGVNRSFTLGSLSTADLQNAVYSDGSVTFAEAIQGFKLYTRIVPRNAAVPSNARSGWTSVSAVIPLGAAATPITVNCATASDVYFGYSVVGNSGWEPAFVGSSRKGQCGPTLAEPGPGKGKGKAIGRQ